jgi:hypothetical protein
MSFTSTRTVVVLALLLHYTLAYGQNPDCPAPTFFKTLGFENKSEFGTVLAKSSDGNLYLAGRNGNKTFIQKTNLAGREIWMREFQASQFEPIDPVEIIEDSDGMIVGCGTQNQFAGARRGFVFRYDPAANVFLWAHPISSNNPTAGGILEKTPGGSFIYYQNPLLANQETDIEIFDLERATGNVIPAFASRYEHISSDKLTRMVSVNGSLFGLGSSVGNHDTSTVARRMLLARFDPTNGNPIWAQLSHQDTVELGDQYGRDMIVDEDALVVAYIGSDSPLGGYRLYLQKSDLDGNIIWVRRYVIYNSVLKLINVPDGYIIYGNRLDNEHVVHKVDKNGITQWSKQITQGVLGLIDESVLAPNLGVAAADSLYFTGIAQNGITDVFFWKLLADGTMVDSCGFAENTSLTSTAFLNPVKTPIDLKKLISTAVFSNVNPAWTTNSLEEQLLCPDCTIPDPCPEDNDFKVEINSISCSGGSVKLSFSICDLNGGELPDLSVSFYNANPLTSPADRIGVYNYGASGPDSCATIQLNNLESLFGTDAVQNGFQIFALVNDPGITNTPIASNDFPLSDLAECAYTNNLDSFVVQLPGSPSLNLGPDQTICSNETALINAGTGFFKYQWSNGATTQSILTSTSGQYSLTVTDVCGFQQVDTVAIVVRITPFVSENAAFCPGKSVTVRGFTFNQQGTFQETIPGNGNDCDTTVTFFITRLPYEERIEVVYICPFTTVTINGVVYEDSGLVRDTVSSTVSCDTIVFYFITQLTLPFRNIQLNLCPGETVVFNGQVYDQPVSFTDTLYSSGFGCDTIAYVTINLAQQPEKSETIQFCPGSSVVINGVAYTQPGEVKAPKPSITGGCDTLVTYTLQFGPIPSSSKTLKFCQGESIVLGGQTYTQPGTVTLLVPGSNGSCDTLFTYTLIYVTPQPSIMSLACPLTVTVATTPGTGPTPVTYNAPVVTSNCECTGSTLTLTSGPASGGLFPVGNTQVCYSATDLCGSTKTCCFTVTVREELPCDTKTNGCIKYDLLGITVNGQQQRTYRIRVTNNCTSALIYTAIQLPDGLSAVSPANFSTYTSPDGRNYAVRNPNYSPFYSIRFKSTNDSIANGESDVFEYTLPAQANPTFINITSRLLTQSFYAAHLNTFNCPIGVTPGQNRNAEEALTLFRTRSETDALLLFPNPTNGELFADLSPWQDQDLNIQILDSRGMRIQTLSLFANSEAQSIPLASAMPAGLYFLEIVTENGERKLGRFVLER